MREVFYEAIPLDVLLSDESHQISLIKGTLRLDVGHFDAYFIPVLRAYASYVHLLPGSEHHHHDWAGGLFSHGLDVALGSVRGSRKYLYGHHELPRLKDTIEERWRLGVTLAGLLHDAGKAFAGLEVSSESGLVWNPHFHSLIEWIDANKISRYRIKWIKGRDSVHSRVGSSILFRLIPQPVINHLTEYGGDIWQSITQTTAGENKDERFGLLVKAADHWSVSQDLQSRGMTSESTGLRERPENVILRSMRKLVSDGFWKWNRPGSRLWLIEDNVYVVWRAGVQDLVKGFHEDAITGFNFDADGMADILIERGVAVSCQKQDGMKSRYWRFDLPGIEKSPYLLRLSSDVSISDELPESIEQIPPCPSSVQVKRVQANTNVHRNQLKVAQQSQPTGLSQECMRILQPLIRENDLRLIRKTPHGLFIRHRESAKHLGMEASVFLDILVKENIHQCDPRYPMKPVREIDGNLGLLLSQDASELLDNNFGENRLEAASEMEQEGMSLEGIMSGGVTAATREKVAERLASKKTKSYGVYDAK